MPPPRKIDLMPDQLRAWLTEELTDRGFAEIEDVTEALNRKLESAGLELSIGKTAVGNFSKVLKTQRQAMNFAEAILKEGGVEKEAKIHSALMQMIAAEAAKLLVSASEEDRELSADELMKMGRMMKDVWASSASREKQLEAAREKAADEARRQLRDEQAQQLEDLAATEPGVSADIIARIRNDVLGVRS